VYTISFNRLTKRHRTDIAVDDLSFDAGADSQAIVWAVW
jgi:hypothetical protein